MAQQAVFVKSSRGGRLLKLGGFLLRKDYEKMVYFITNARQWGARQEQRSKTNL